MNKSDMPKKEKKNREDKDYEKPIVAKTAYDLQRLKLMKLMKNPEKPVLLPERPKSKNSPSVPEFVRNVMGSSAGAGSGEFHVYRHLRRKEYSRQKFIQEKGRKETLDEEYHRKIEENKIQAENTTSKKRAKRLKKKQKKKQAKKLKLGTDCKDQKTQSEDSDSDSSKDGRESDKSEEKMCIGSIEKINARTDINVQERKDSNNDEENEEEDKCAEKSTEKVSNDTIEKVDQTKESTSVEIQNDDVQS